MSDMFIETFQDVECREDFELLQKLRPSNPLLTDRTYEEFLKARDVYYALMGDKDE